MFAGSHEITVRDQENALSFRALVMYPTQTPSTPTPFGPYAMDVSPDAPIAPGEFPLIIVSHGSGGSHLLYRTITTPLAQNGYIVAMLEHPGNNRDNNELENTYENLVNRPRHIRLTIEAVAANDRFSRCIQTDTVAIIGHSLGGYAALAVAGGAPWANPQQKIDVTPDPRIRALVLMAPAAAYYQPQDSLKNVTVPILLLAAENDPFTPEWQTDIILDRVPDRSKVTYRQVENAGHFSFLSPFPPRMISKKFLPSTDPKGFDRVRFHEQLPADIIEFLNSNLSK